MRLYKLLSVSYILYSNIEFQIKKVAVPNLFYSEF